MLTVNRYGIKIKAHNRTITSIFSGADKAATAVLLVLLHAERAAAGADG